MKYTLKQVTEAVNHWSMLKLSEAEVNYFLKSLEELPPFQHDIKTKTIIFTEKERKENVVELKQWKEKGWLLVKAIEFKD